MVALAKEPLCITRPSHLYWTAPHMTKTKYDEFVVSTPYEKISKVQNSESQASRRKYVKLFCPYCDPNSESPFKELALEKVATGRAFECGRHVLECAAAQEGGAELPVARNGGKKKQRSSPLDAESDEGRDTAIVPGGATGAVAAATAAAAAAVVTPGRDGDVVGAIQAELQELRLRSERQTLQIEQLQAGAAVGQQEIER
eukprot:66428-Prymnesium_polylepis.1